MTGKAINRREFLKYTGAGLATLALPKVLTAGQDRKPNIVVIIADDLGYADLGCYGCKDIPTPHIDSIAANGVRFTDGYVTCPVCSPTRAALITGRYQQRFGYEFNPGSLNSSEVFGLPLTETTIASRLQSAGYTTGVAGKWHLGGHEKYHPLKRGFDEFFGFPAGAHSYVDHATDGNNPIMRGYRPVAEKEYLTDAFARESVAFIERHRLRPFFLYLSFNAVHSPLQAPQNYLDQFADISDPKRRTFAGMLSAMDDAVGQVLNTIRKNRLEDDTLIIFIGDNGGPTLNTTSRNYPLRAYKGDVYEGGIRVPYMIQWKGRVPAGKVYRNLVSSLDIVPTAMAAAGVSRDGAKLDGVDLLPHVTKSSNRVPHDILYWRFGEQSAVRQGNWKLVRTPDGGEELFDLAADVGETTNLAEANPAKLKQLNDRLMKWNSELEEPRWRTIRNRNPANQRARRNAR